MPLDARRVCESSDVVIVLLPPVRKSPHCHVSTAGTNSPGRFERVFLHGYDEAALEH